MDDRDVDEAELRAEPRGEAAAVEGVEASKSDRESVMVRLSNDFLEAGRLEDVTAAIFEQLSGNYLEKGRGKGAIRRERNGRTTWFTWNNAAVRMVFVRKGRVNRVTQEVIRYAPSNSQFTLSPVPKMVC